MQIPTEKDWEDAQNVVDLDLPYAYELFAGKSNAEVQHHFKRNPLERSFEIGVMPTKPFQYYMIGFRDFIMTGDFQQFTSSDAASAYLRLIERKLKSKPSDITPIYIDLVESINFVAENQSTFEADEDIYGSFLEIRNNILELYAKDI